MNPSAAAIRIQKEYSKTTRKSHALYKKSMSCFPGGISHNIRYFAPYPFYTKFAKGKYLRDVDGNNYTDYWMGHWALLIGHSHPVVASAVRRQTSHGTLFGTVNKWLGSCLCHKEGNACRADPLFHRSEATRTRFDSGPNSGGLSKDRR
jgi:hypothetical protein